MSQIVKSQLLVQIRHLIDINGLDRVRIAAMVESKKGKEISQLDQAELEELHKWLVNGSFIEKKKHTPQPSSV